MLPRVIYSASWLFPGDGPPVRDGWIEVQGERVTAVGSGTTPAGAETRRFDRCALTPGLVNAHCHLELTTLHDRLDRGKPFPTWVEQLRGYTAGLDAADYRHAAREGVRRLLAGGCTAVLDVGNTGEAPAALAESPLRALALVETLGLDPSLAATRASAAEAVVSRLAPARGNKRFRGGVTPHAAYSCSPELLCRVIDAQRKRTQPVTLHACESREEAELFAEGAGPLADYCRRIFADAPRHQDTTPIRWLESLGLLPEGTIIAHGNLLNADDMEILARRGASVVHCPSSHDFFGHPRFPYEELRARGIPVCLGTDSLASGDSLSMLDQARRFHLTYPKLSMWEVLAAASAAGARALNLEGVGFLRPGSAADFVIVPCDAPEILLENEPEARLVVIDGAETRFPGD